MSTVHQRHRHALIKTQAKGRPLPTCPAGAANGDGWCGRAGTQTGDVQLTALASAALAAFETGPARGRPSRPRRMARSSCTCTDVAAEACLELLEHGHGML